MGFEAVGSGPSQTDGAFCSVAINNVSALGDDDLAGGDEVAGGGADGGHEWLPCGAFGRGGEGARRFAGADGCAGAAGVEQAEDGLAKLL